MLQLELNKLRPQFEEVSKENAKLKLELDSEKTSAIRASKDLKLTQEELERLKKQMEELKQQNLDLLERQHKHLRKLSLQNLKVNPLI